MKVNFLSSKDRDEKLLIHSESNSRKIMIGVDTKGIIRKLFNSLLNRYQAVLEQSMIGSDFAFDDVKIIFLRKPWWVVYRFS